MSHVWILRVVGQNTNRIESVSNLVLFLVCIVIKFMPNNIWTPKFRFVYRQLYYALMTIGVTWHTVFESRRVIILSLFRGQWLRSRDENRLKQERLNINYWMMATSFMSCWNDMTSEWRLLTLQLSIRNRKVTQIPACTFCKYIIFSCVSAS